MAGNGEATVLIGCLPVRQGCRGSVDDGESVDLDEHLLAGEAGEHRGARGQDAAGRVETTFQLLLGLGPVWNAFSKAKNAGKISGETTEELARDAAAKNIIQPQDVERIIEYDARRFDCLLTDSFDQL